MVARFQYLPEISSGGFFELRELEIYRTLKGELTFFQDKDGALYREAGMATDALLIGSPCQELGGSEATDRFGGVIECLEEGVFESGSCRVDGFSGELFLPGAVLLSGQVTHSGSRPWFGWGVHADYCDAIGIQVFSDRDELVSEARIPFPYRCVLPGEAVRFSQAFSLASLQLGAGRYRLEADLVRDGVGWYSDYRAHSPVSLQVAPGLEPVELEYERFDTASPMLALTFDGGSSAQRGRELLAVLRGHNLRCTFFLTGRFMHRFPELVREIHRDGHEVGNHTLSHRRLCFDRDPLLAAGVDRSVIERELSQAGEVYRNITGESLAPLWRAPFGQRNSLALLWALHAGYRHIFWSYDSRDWRIGVGASAPTSADIVRDAIDYLRGGERKQGRVLLFHVASASSNDPLFPGIDQIISEAVGLGYQLGTVTELMNKGLSPQ